VKSLSDLQEQRPSILKELNEDGGLEVEPAHAKYTADTDTLVLEDDTMRAPEEGEADRNKLQVGGDSPRAALQC
jgi:hypothetical protein